MTSLDERILYFIKKYMTKLSAKKVLTSMEEVEANTNETNLVGAPVIAELNNKLSGCSIEQEGEHFYIVGADSVRKKLGSGDVTISVPITLVGNATDGNGGHRIQSTSEQNLVITIVDGVASANFTNMAVQKFSGKNAADAYQTQGVIANAKLTIGEITVMGADSV